MDMESKEWYNTKGEYEVLNREGKWWKGLGRSNLILIKRFMSYDNLYLVQGKYNEIIIRKC